MSIANKFESFCNNLRMKTTDVEKVSTRRKAITKRLNTDFRNVSYETMYSLQVGSYGRGTAIHLSDVDILYVLPCSEYHKYNDYRSNGQSALLQAIKQSISKTYTMTNISGDGQVVKVSFGDGIYFEVVPCFEFDNGSFYYPDTNNGGSWKTTNPRPEINAINTLNNSTNKNLKRLCRMIRAWKDHCNVPMGGLLIDTLAHRFLSSWGYKDKSFVYYDWMTRDFFKYLSELDDNQSYWYAVGSGQRISPCKFVAKAKKAHNNALEAIQNENNDFLSNYYWKEIYGSKF